METKNTKIYMIVDTENIQSGDVDKWVEFRDNRKNPDPKPNPANFTSEIGAGEKVFWFGEPKNQSRDTIEITGIQKKADNGPELIKDIGRAPTHRGAFIAQVIDDYTEGFESYSITFRIKEHKAEYEVDPKLTMSR